MSGVRLRIRVLVIEPDDAGAQSTAYLSVHHM